MTARINLSPPAFRSAHCGFRRARPILTSLYLYHAGGGTILTSSCYPAIRKMLEDITVQSDTAVSGCFPWMRNWFCSRKCQSLDSVVGNEVSAVACITLVSVHVHVHDVLAGYPSLGQRPSFHMLVGNSTASLSSKKRLGHGCSFVMGWMHWSAPEDG
jgi:hypothetical protein